MAGCPGKGGTGAIRTGAGVAGAGVSVAGGACPGRGAGGLKLRWHLVLLPSLAISFLLIAASQYVFLRGSFYADLRVGRLGNVFTLQNYERVFSDNFYLASLWLTVQLSAIVAALTLLFGYPVAYMIARMRSHWSIPSVSSRHTPCSISCAK